MNSSDVKTTKTNSQFKVPRVIYFGISGLPGFVIAIGLNYTLVDLLNLNVYGSYIVVLIVVSLMNYFIIDKYIFPDQNKKNSTLKKFTGFAAVIVTSRVLEWMMYSLIVYHTNIYYIFIQIFVSTLFVFIKYFILKKIFK